MWCDTCKRETEHDICSACGNATREDTPSVVFWCDNCKIPILHSYEENEITCPICTGPAHYLSSDIRPVFPEERLLFEILKRKPLEYINCSVWAYASKYYVDGKSYSLSNAEFSKADAKEVAEQIKKFAPLNHYADFEKHVDTFVKANSNHLNQLYLEASSFIEKSAQDFPTENLVISFSGGKDSTVTADLVTRALSNPYLVHIFGDTTLEFPSTIDYAKRFRENHPFSIFKTARNNEQSFFDMAEIIGPPARMMRWCCSMFKTGPISRVFNNFYRNENILTYYGIRKRESISRSKYNRIENDAESVKIQRQKVASPVFFWCDADIWLYILSQKIDFNDAYRLGYDRVGCWCCPNNGPRAQFLSKLYMPEQADDWRNFLIDFAKKVGKPDPEVYVDSGKWKARQGGNGLPAAKSVKVKANQCATEEDAYVFSLERPYSDKLVGLFTPIGILAPGLGRKLINEDVFVDPKTKTPLFSIMPFRDDSGSDAVKIKLLENSKANDTLRMARYQVIKYNACRQCLKCESLCRFGAITVSLDEYVIDKDKCEHCQQCVKDKYLEGGCLMRKYLRTKEI